MRIAVIPGDGIGVEVTAEALKVLRAAGSAFGRTLEFEMLPWSADYYLQSGVTIPPNGYAMLRDEFDAIFIGALGDPRVADNRHARDILLGIRFELDLYVNYRPVRLLHERLCPLKGRGVSDVDFVVFRENTEGLYVSIGGRFKAGTDDEVAIQEEVNTYKGVHRIVRHAFEYARANRRKKVCMADKSNAMTQGHALWQRVFREVGSEYPEIEARHLYIDALALLMVQDPAQFDVIVTNNLFGDIITDLARRAAGRARPGGVGQHPSGPHVDVRAGARLGAAAGGEERREPDGRHSVRRAHARNARHETGGAGDRSGGEAGRREWEWNQGDRRNARYARNGRLHHGTHIAAFLITKPRRTTKSTKNLLYRTIFVAS